MTLQEAIEKYNLEKQDRNLWGDKVYYDLYTGKKTKNNIDYIFTLDNQMSTDLDDGSIYFLHIEKFDYNNMVYDKQLDFYRPKMAQKTTEIIDNERSMER